MNQIKSHQLTKSMITSCLMLLAKKLQVLWRGSAHVTLPRIINGHCVTLKLGMVQETSNFLRICVLMQISCLMTKRQPVSGFVSMCQRCENLTEQNYTKKFIFVTRRVAVHLRKLHPDQELNRFQIQPLSPLEILVILYSNDCILRESEQRQSYFSICS